MLHPGIIALGLLCLAVPAAAQTDTTRPSPATMREIVVRWNADWGKARLALDTAVLERMLPASYTARVGGETMSREEFMNVAKSPPPEIHLTRFDASVLTVQPDSTWWIATVQEKLEFTRRNEDGTLERRAALWIIKDRWEKVNGQWAPVFGEVVGNETWRKGARPPFSDW